MSVAFGFVDSVLNGQKLKIGLIQDPPYSVVDPPGGVGYEVIRLLSQVYNFTMEEVVFKTRFPIGQARDELISKLQAREIDVAAIALLMRNHHNESGFTRPYGQEDVAVIVSKQRRGMDVLLCSEPYGTLMWWMLLIAIVVLPLVLWLLQRRRGPPNESDLLQTFQFVFGVLLNQAQQRISPSGYLGTILVVVWCVSAVFFVYVYIADFAAVLGSPPPPQTRSDTSVKSLLEMGFDFGTTRALREELFQGKLRGYSEVIRRRLKNLPAMETDTMEGVQRVQAGGYFFIDTLTSLREALMRMETMEGRRRLVVTMETFLTRPVALGVRLNSSLPDLFNFKIQRMVETGLIDHWTEKYSSKLFKDFGKQSRDHSDFILSSDDMKGTFLVLASALTLSVLVFVGELVRAHFGKN